MSVSEAQRAAARYSMLGLGVVPIRLDTKRPALKWADRPAEPPSVEELRDWYGRWPNAGVGCIIGDRYAVLDVDEHGISGLESLAELEAEHGPLPHTWRELTPTGGLHVWFQVNGHAVATRELAPGVQLRTGRHVLVMPPAIGRVWEIDPDEAELAPLPEWLTAATHKRGRAPVAPDEPITEGHRHAFLLRLAGALRRQGADEGTIRAALHQANQTRCSPPKDEADVEALAADVTERYAPERDTAGNPPEKITASTDDELRAQLSAALRLDAAGLSVAGAEIHGRGPNAVVAIHLSDGTTIDADRFSDLMNTGRLGALVISATGTPVMFKALECATVAALTVRLAKRVAVVTADDLAREWGAAYLRAATVIELDMADQGERWRAFAQLDELDPIATARHSARAIAGESVVLRDARTKARYVHSAWFLAHVRRDVGPINAAELVNRMSYAGWQRRGARGRIKATNAADGRTIQIPLYIVPDGWEAQ